MATNLYDIDKTVEVMVARTQATYNPLFSIFSKKNEFNVELGKLSLKDFDTVGEIKAAQVNAQDTETARVETTSSKKTFYKNIFALIRERSSFQGAEGDDALINKIINGLSEQLDKRIWAGTTSFDNNGIFGSADANYVSNASAAIASTLAGLLDKIQTLKDSMETATGKGVVNVLAYGDTKTKLRQINANTAETFSSIIARTANVNMIEVPNNVLVSTESGIIMYRDDMVALNHTAMPRVYDTDEDKKASSKWVKFIFGDAMLDVETKGAMSKQPLTYSS